MPDQDFDYDVFVSHAGEDSSWSERLAERLRRDGLRVWFDKWEIKPGDHLLVKLNDGLDRSAKMVTVWSSNYFRDGKTWTLAEIFGQMHEDPLSAKRCLIPVLLENCKIPPTCLNQVYIDFRREEDFEDSLQKLIESLPPSAYAIWHERKGKQLKAVVEQLKQGTARLRLTSQEIIIKTSELLQDFRIIRANKTIYLGRAVVQAVIPRESDILCTVSLDQLLSIPKALTATCSTIVEMRVTATPVRSSQNRVIVEFPPQGNSLKASQVLQDFKLFVGESQVFSGRATIINTLSTDTEALCELSLDRATADVGARTPVPSPTDIDSEIGDLIQLYGKHSLLTPEFRLAISDLESFLLDIRNWAELFEFRLAAFPTEETADQHDELLRMSFERLSDALNELSARSDDAAASAANELGFLHRWFAQTRLRPLILSSPFGFRSYTKPSGYNGDYETIKMVSGNLYTGPTNFAKIVQCRPNSPVIRDFRRGFPKESRGVSENEFKSF